MFIETIQAKPGNDKAARDWMDGWMEGWMNDGGAVHGNYLVWLVGWLVQDCQIATVGHLGSALVQSGHVVEGRGARGRLEEARWRSRDIF